LKRFLIILSTVNSVSYAAFTLRATSNLLRATSNMLRVARNMLLQATSCAQQATSATFALV